MSRYTDETISIARLTSFSDGVFAIAVTLLVFNLKVPHIAANLVHEQLPSAMLGMLPNFSTYIISFLLVATYWTFHHRMMNLVERIDTPFLWMNIYYLLVISFIPFPPAIFDRDIDPIVFYSNYLQTYIEKDVTELANLRDLKAFRTFIGLCAGRSAQLVNFSALANECDISHNTAKAWLSILESSYIIFFLQPYHQNFNKRLVKSPKLYFYDTGLLNYLLGIREAGELEENRIKGAVFENMIVAEYQKKNHHLYLHKDYYFWQDSNAHEVDLLMKKPGGFAVFEAKATQTINSTLFEEMDRFEQIAAPSKVNKTLIYGGAENEKRTKYNVLSWKNISD